MAQNYWFGPGSTPFKESLVSESGTVMAETDGALRVRALGRGDRRHSHLCAPSSPSPQGPSPEC